MGLKKKIKQTDGVETDYHRILYLQLTTNKGCSIAVVSYVDESAREVEMTGENEAVYKKAMTYELPYDENMTVKKAYNELKKMDKFSDAEDV